MARTKWRSNEQNDDNKPELLDEAAASVMTSKKTEAPEIPKNIFEPLNPIRQTLADGPGKIAIGRVVHYYGYSGDGPYAALVTKIKDNNSVNLHIFPGHESPYIRPDIPLSDVPYSEKQEPNTWSWPPRTN